MLENHSNKKWRLIPGIMVILLLSQHVNAQISKGGSPLKSHLKADAVEWVDLEEVTTEAILLEKELTAGYKNQPIAEEIAVSLQPEYSGSWKELSDGTLIWRIGVRGKGAKGLGIVFDRYVLEKGTRIFICDPSGENLLGAYTSLNNKTNGNLAISYLQGDELIIQMEVPPECENYGELRIGTVRWAYLPVVTDKSFKDGLFGTSGECNIDINCSLGDDWQIVKNSVVRMINIEKCTGVLINNVRQDEKAYVYTAAHCVFQNNTYQSTIFYFDYESPTCHGPDGSVTKSISGATLLATGDTLEYPNDEDSLDFALLELSIAPPDSFMHYFAGWNRSTSPAQNTTTIHHPRGDVKKIAIDLDPPEVSYHDPDFFEDLVRFSHWRILEWDTATTENGSSGSPLFNENQVVVGTLTGGQATCSNQINDYYTRFDYAWDYYPEPAKQLKHWLDPDNSGVMILPGLVPLSQRCVLDSIQLDKYDITCKDSTNGKIDLSVAGSGPMVYKWSNGDTIRNISGLSAGWYKITVTDSVGCFLSDSIEILEPDQLLLMFTDSVNPTFYGFSDGSATIGVEGGIPPYQYLWDDPLTQTDPTANGLEANIIYRVLIKDSFNCSALDSITLSESNTLFTSISDKQNISCYGYADGAARVEVIHGEYPYEYLWDDKNQTSDSIIEMMEANIIYHVSVTDAMGNVGTDSVILSQPDTLIADIDQTQQISCFGEEDGEATVLVSGGTAPYLYNWNDSPQTETSEITGLSASRYYRVIVTDSNLCTATDSIQLVEPEKVVTSSITGLKNVVEAETGEYSVSANPGSNFSWLIENGHILSGQGNNSVDVQWSVPGEGKISVLETDENSCSGDTIYLEVDIGGLAIDPVQNPEIKIYPNPFLETTTIQFPNPDTESYKLVLTDPSGKVCRIVDDIRSSEYVLERKNLKGGLYFIELHGPKIYRGKIIIK